MSSYTDTYSSTAALSAALTDDLLPYKSYLVDDGVNPTVRYSYQPNSGLALGDNVIAATNGPANARFHRAIPSGPETDIVWSEDRQVQSASLPNWDLYDLVTVSYDTDGVRKVVNKNPAREGLLINPPDADLFELTHWSKVVVAPGGAGGAEVNVMEFHPVLGMVPIVEIEAIGGDIPAGSFTVRGVRIGGTTASASNAAIIPTGQANVAVIDFSELPEAVGYSIDVDTAIPEFRVSVGFKAADLISSPFNVISVVADGSLTVNSSAVIENLSPDFASTSLVGGESFPGGTKYTIYKTSTPVAVVVGDGDIRVTGDATYV